MVSLDRVRSIDHIHSKTFFLNIYFYSTSVFKQNVKAYNAFMSIDTYEFKKLTIIKCVATASKVLDKSKTLNIDKLI